MRPKLVIPILVLALAGTNSYVASMCASYCISSPSAGIPAVRHHHMESRSDNTIASNHIHAHHHGVECAECPPKSANRLNQKADCARSVQVLALKEGSFAFDAPSGVAHFDVADTPAYSVGFACDGERSLVFDTSPIIRSSSSASVPLRI